MKRAIECRKCSNCVIYFTAGFLSVPNYYCSLFCMNVDKNDGCTFGIKGLAQKGRTEGFVDISQDVKVDGREVSDALPGMR